MEFKKNEIRTIPCQLAIRESAGNEEGQSRTITGTAIVFDSESEVLDDFGFKFREIIRPSACTQEFLDSQDIKMNMLHDRQLTLARANHGKGTLKLTVTERGVDFEFEAPKCDIGDRCLEMVRRGDYSGCSFEFFPNEYDIEEQNGGRDVRLIHRSFRALTAVTIGLDPAYRATSVSARELADETPEAVQRKEESKQKAYRQNLQNTLESMKMELDNLTLTDL